MVMLSCLGVTRWSEKYGIVLDLHPFSRYAESDGYHRALEQDSALLHSGEIGR